MPLLRPLLISAALLAAPMIAPPAAAQNLFTPAATVNGMPVTEFELGQRQRMLQAFGAPDTSRATVLDALIDERLQMAEARDRGLTISEERILEGMSEFAGRADLDRETFVQRLASDGIDEATFRDFVRAGIAWREVIGQAFGGGQTRIREDVVERAAEGPPEPELRVLLRELILPANNPQNAERSQALVPQISEIDTEAAFAAAAREYSVTPSREEGGVIDWIPLSNLPGPIRQALTDLQPGEVSQPFPIENAIAFFQLRAIEEIPDPGTVEQLNYAMLYLPGGGDGSALQEAARLRGQVDSCGDLYGVAQDLPPEQLQRIEQAPAQVPQDIALELAKLDAGEVSTALTRGDSLVFLMLCERSYRSPDDPADLSALRQSLTNQRISQRADNLLSDLRADATVTRQ